MHVTATSSAQCCSIKEDVVVTLVSKKEQHRLVGPTEAQVGHGCINAAPQHRLQLDK
jgi:hypothetical protein